MSRWVFSVAQQIPIAETRNRLIQSGITLFQKNGYHATGLKELLASAGVPKGSFYHYFRSKEHFAADAIREYIRPYIDHLESLLGAEDDLRMLDRLRGYYVHHVGEFERTGAVSGCLLGNLLGEIGDNNPLALSEIDQSVQRYCGVLTEIICAIQVEGDLRQDIAPESLAATLFDAWQGALLRMQSEQSSRPLRQFVDGSFHRLLGPG